ncbi:MAG: hypothetical protein Q8Q35_03625 [Nanoarchaeota archaeon]|nr:hypothetical protein [Nanoarchaeota archaeon]
MNNNKINLKKFIPRILIVPKSKNKYPLLVEDKESYFLIRHTTSHFNNSRRHHSLIIPKSINRNKETFEVLGLLQAEMGKTNNGCIVFANSEYKLVNKVISWLEKELEINHNTWKWYIRINLQEPKDVKLKQELTEKMKNYWIKHTKINPNNSHTKALCFV